jgi:hypothetical protein
LNAKMSLVLGLAFAASARAADLEPRSGLTFAASLGVNQATGPGARSGAGVSVTVDYSPAPWFSLGLTSGYSAPSTDPVGESHDTTEYLGGFVQFDRELPRWRPLIQIGYGHYKFRSNDTSGSFVGLGFEIPAGRRWFIPLTARYHIVDTTAGYDPDFIEWRIGLARTVRRARAGPRPPDRLRGAAP